MASVWDQIGEGPSASKRSKDASTSPWDQIGAREKEPANKPGFFSDVKRGTGQIIESTGSALRDIGAPDVGQSIEEYGAGIVRRNPAQINTVGEALSRPFTTAREAVGEVLPQVGTSIGLGMGMRALGGVLGAPFGPPGVAVGQFLGGAAGAYAGNLMQEYGGIRKEQREQGIEDKTRALGAAGGAAALDTSLGLGGVATRVGIKGLDILSREAGAKLLPHIGKQAAIGVITEFPTEVGQTALERYGAHKAITGEEAFNEYGMAAIKGGLGGGIVRGGMSAIAGQRPEEGGSLLGGSNTGTEIPATPNAPKNEISQDFAVAQSSASAENIMAGLTGPGNLLSGRVPLYEAPTVPAAPVVAGGETDVAFAQQQAAAQNQAAQVKQAEEAKRAAAFETTGATVSPDNGGELTIFGQSVFGPQIPVFGNQLAGQIAALPPQMAEIVKAMATANAETGGKVVSFKYNGANPVGSADALVKALAKAADKFQIGHVESTQQAAGILNKLSETTKGATLDQINAIHFALTGENTTGWEASQTTQAKGAKNGKLQTTAGMGEVPVQGGTGEAISGGAGNVRPAQVEPVGAGSVGAGPLDLQAGQLPAEGIRTGAGADTGAGAGNLVGQGQGPGALNETAGQPQGPQVVAGGGQIPGEQPQTGQPAVDQVGVPTEARVYEPRISYYASDLSHIPATRRIEIITQLLHSVLAPKQERGNVIQAATRMEILRLALLEQGSHKEIAEYTKLTEAAVAKQLERMGVALVDGQFDVTDPAMADRIRTAAADFRSAEFPDGIGEGELAGLYATKYEGPDVEAKTMAEEMQEGEQEGKPGAKLQEELYGKEEGEGQTMGTVATAGGSQGAVETDDTAFFAKVEKMQAQLEQLAPQDPRREQLAKDIKSAWDKYAKKQADRAEADVAVEAEGEENAIQEPSAEEVPVRQRARGGKKVGKGDTEGGKAAAEGKPAAEEVRTPQEQWEALAEKTPGMPPYESLTKDERTRWDDLAHRGVANLAAANEIVGGSDLKFGKDTTESKVKNPYTAAQLLAEIKAFVRADIPGRKLIIVDSVEDLLASPDPKVREVAQALARNGAYGVATDGRGFLIANRIEQGRGRAKFMHEVGAHLGLENLLPKALYDKLTQQLVDWAKRADDSLESDLAIRAAERVLHARTPKEDQRSELLAYFIEEAMQAGIDPTAEVKNSPALTAWFRTLWAAFKIAVRKLGFNPEKLTAQDVVNLAFGAARLEMSGTFHGTAAQFRKFSHKFMGSGEGAQAYGWGTYLAQRPGIAKGYWAADIARKSGGSLDMQAYVVDGKTYTYSDGASTQAQNNYFAAELLANPQLLAKQKSNPAPGFEDVVAIASKWQAEGKVSTLAKGPEGAFMRVDTALDSSNTLNWDTPLSQQPEVLATLREKLPLPIQEAIADQFDQNVEDLSDLTGEDLYRALQYLENSQGLVTEFMENEAAGQKADKIASKFLDSIGIAGLKFLDATSRKQARVEERIAQAERKLAREEQALRDLHTQLDKERQELMDKLAAAEAEVAAGKKWSKMSVDQMNRFIARLDDPNGTNALLLSVYEDNVRMAKDNLATQQAKLTAPVTRNLVVFNDANIFRVGSAIGADKQRMKFGVESNIQSLPKAAQKPVRNSIASITDFANKALDRLVFTSDVVNRAVDAGIQSARKFERLLAERGTKARELERAVERIADQYATLPERDKGTGPDSVNQFLFDSTRTMKWGYGQYRDAEMGARFDALDPKSQEFIKSVFSYGDKILSQKKQTVVDYTTSEYDAAIAKESDPAKKAQLRTDKAADLKKFETLFAIREGKPYAPIKRVGDYVVVAKSDAYREAEQNGDTKELRKLESDPDHYHVSFTETKSEARALADQLREQGFFGASADAVDFFEKAKYGEDLFGNSSSLDAITRLRSMTDAKAAAGEKGAAALQRLVTDLYLQSLAEGSARKSEMRRRGVAGEVDMLRSFAAQGRADAQFIASVEMNPQVQDAIQEMRGQVARGGNRERKSELMNELMARYDQTLERTPNPVINKITRLSSIYYLATSPAYYLQNLTQPWMMSLPAMAGHHDYGKASTQLFKAYTDLGGVMKSAQLFGQQFDFSKVPADVRQAIQELANRGKIDIGLETELGEFKIDGSGKLTDRWNKVDKGLRIAVQKVEAINRLSTAIAAYRLELAKTGSAVKALDYADRILTETHGDYTGFNAPRAFNHPVGKVALQFRKFQLIQLTFYAKLIRDAFTGADRAMAMKTLAYSLGHTGMLAGVIGLPGYAAVSAILGALFGDDDEEYDLTKELRKMIGDEDIANLILRGAPTIAGMDLSGKVGAGNMLSIMPFSNADLTTKSGVYEAFGQLLGGAAVGMAARFADGLGLMLSGNWYKGLEQMLPKGAADAMKAARIANEGMTRRNGDVVLPESEISSLDTVWQALGISPVKQSVVYERQQNIREMDQKFQDRSTEIKNRYTKAAKSGDTAEMAAQREAWTKLQTARMNNGYTRQPISELLKAPQQQAKRERQTVGGVQYNKANRAAVMAEANL